jgi:hypothetical protein
MNFAKDRLVVQCGNYTSQHLNSEVRKIQAMKVIQSNGLYFVDGQGFTARDPKLATKIAPADVECRVKCARAFGLLAQVEDAPAQVSYGVVYIRKGDVNGVQINKQAPNARVGATDPSKRRFATEQEAITHGSRFNVRKARKGDQPGTAGHRGFFIVETNDPVNSAVNPATGLTNSL